jgi:NADPH:quinone reductase-like Zn-dependent oxidoreductase
MRAAVYSSYGPPNVIQIKDIEKPIPNDNEVLIKVRAASVNPSDWHLMRGMPYSLRITVGLRKPKITRLGMDVAGHVEAVGRNATQFKPGDEVFGLCRGAFAEYACTSESGLVLKPGNVTFEQAASVPAATFTALQGLRDKGKIQPGQQVLINGAAGGVGTFAVQIAKSFGAEVTGICSTRNVEMVRSIGADRVIVNGGPDGRCIGPLARGIRALGHSCFVSQDLVMFLVRKSREDLTIMRDLIKAGKVTSVIDRRYGLDEGP